MPDYRKIEPGDDLIIAGIIRDNLEKFHLNIPGTAYYDPELDHLSTYYGCDPDKRVYFIALDQKKQVIGGVGIAEYREIFGCAELQKLYLCDSAKGKGYGRKLVQLAEEWARVAGYREIYLETHTNLSTAIALYEKMGYCEIARPHTAVHGTMNVFFWKKLT